MASLFSFQDLQDSKQTTTEEVKPKSKYPSFGQKPGGSDFLMKRLQKGVGQLYNLNQLFQSTSG